MMEVESAFESMQSRKSQLQEELTNLKKQFTRIANGEGDFEQTKSHLQSEVCVSINSFLFGVILIIFGSRKCPWFV